MKTFMVICLLFSFNTFALDGCGEGMEIAPDEASLEILKLGGYVKFNQDLYLPNFQNHVRINEKLIISFSKGYLNRTLKSSHPEMVDSSFCNWEEKTGFSEYIIGIKDDEIRLVIKSEIPNCKLTVADLHQDFKDYFQICQVSPL